MPRVPGDFKWVVCDYIALARPGVPKVAQSPTRIDARLPILKRRPTKIPKVFRALRNLG